VILGVDGQARQILEEAGGGIAIEPENSRALISSIEHLHANRQMAHSMGQKGREYITKNFSRARTAEKYIEVLEDLRRTT
jgi:glycosyltransferase involved in cell wall biosynthesis